ncbi:MAG: serine hydrolase [Rhodospirillales bacterium]|nr:serine hydrolase [Rhodospirillales bacterium]
MFARRISLSIAILFSVLCAACVTEPQDRSGLAELPTDYSINIHNWHHENKAVSAFSGGMERIFKFRVVKKGLGATPLPYSENQYVFEDVDNYLTRNRVMGVLIIKDGNIVLEKYAFDRSESHRFQSKSMVKSVVSLLIGMAIEEGKIASIDDLAKRYLPDLDEHPYGNTSIRHLLQMSSGVKFKNMTDYPKTSDTETLERVSWRGYGPGGLSTVMPFKNRPRISTPGTKFYYSSAETQVLGLILRETTGMPLSDYLSEKIWRPMGAESSATWWVDKSGQEPAYDGLGATLRDYARLGVLLANDGAIGGNQIVPKKWVLEATQPTPGYPHLKPGRATSYHGYGYQFWIMPTHGRQFAMLGGRGQAVFVDPNLKLVMAQNSAFKKGDDTSPRELHELWRDVVRKYQR